MVQAIGQRILKEKEVIVNNFFTLGSGIFVTLDSGILLDFEASIVFGVNYMSFILLVVQCFCSKKPKSGS